MKRMIPVDYYKPPIRTFKDMDNNCVISSILDNDLYTLSVCYFYLNKFPRAEGVYTFVDRNNEVFPQGFAERVMTQVKMMESLTITPEECEFLTKKCYYFPKWFLTTFLQGYRFDASEVGFWQDEEGHLRGAVMGPLWRAVFWEVPLLAIISELAHQERGETVDYDEQRERVRGKWNKFNYAGCVFSDFGTRRRFSFAVQDTVVSEFASLNFENKVRSFKMFDTAADFVGTSNMLLAMKYNLTPVGTMSHQVVSGIGALFGYQEANFLAMDYWQQVFQADLGTYLYDTYGWDAFQRNFTKKHANLFKALRVDSGDDFEQMENIIYKYCELGVDPSSKYITFSNALTTEKAVEIKHASLRRIGVNFGIGTHFTCDVPGVSPLNIVMKLTDIRLTEKTEWHKAVKLSNDASKATGDPEEIELCKKVLRIND